MPIHLTELKKYMML